MKMMWLTAVKSAGVEGGGGGGGGGALFGLAEVFPAMPPHPAKTSGSTRAMSFRRILIPCFDESGCSRVVLSIRAGIAFHT